jgi:hypothetical protein
MSPKTPTFASEWESYNRRVVRPDATAVERWECQLAFYGGARALYYRLCSAPTAEQVEALRVELGDFTAMIFALAGDDMRPTTKP